MTYWLQHLQVRLGNRDVFKLYISQHFSYAGLFAYQCLLKLSKILDKTSIRSVNNSLIPRKMSDTLCAV